MQLYICFLCLFCPSHFMKERPKLLHPKLNKQSLTQSIISWILNSPGKRKDLTFFRTWYLKTSMVFSWYYTQEFLLNVNTHNFPAFVLWLICKRGFSSFCYKMNCSSLTTILRNILLTTIRKCGVFLMCLIKKEALGPAEWCVG